MEYGSIISVENYDWNLLRRFISNIDVGEQMSMDTIGLVETTDGLSMLVEIAAAMAQKYDVVLTNPPYMGSGGMGEKLTKYVQSEFPDSKNDLYSVFIEHCQIMLKPNRFCAMITQHSWMFLTTFEKLRSKVLFNSISSMIHLGARAFEEISGEVVQTVAFILRSSTILSYEAKFARLVDGNYKEKEKIYLQHKNIFIQKQETYKAIPGCTYMYWASKKTFSLFSGKKIGDLFDVKSGLSTGDNELYVRNWYEINSAKLSVFSHSQNSGWVPYNKGGGIRKWYGINICIVNWGTDGDKIKNSGKAVFRNPSFYFREGITWSGIASSGGTFRYCPEGYLFDSNKGPMIFNRKDNLKYLLGLLNSKIAQKIIKIGRAHV